MVGLTFNSVEEARALKHFVELVGDLNQDELTCLRFLRARNHESEKAEEMIRKSLEWRKTNEVDTCQTWISSKDVDDTFSYAKSGLGNDGHPVMYLPVGKWETRKFLEKGMKADLLKKMVLFLEDLMSYVRQSSKHQFYIIIDMNGSTYHKVAHYETVQTILHVFRTYEANYPETLFKAVVINAPWVFSYIFPLVKPIFSRHTMTKLAVFDSNVSKWKAALLCDMPESSLPAVHCPRI